MTIVKTYCAQIDHSDGSIDNVTVKARNVNDATSKLNQQYPDVGYIGTPERLSKNLKYWRSFGRSIIFPHRLARGGQYIFRHKGRKAKHRPNTPEPSGGWWPVGSDRMTFTYTESYAPGFTKALTDWVENLGQMINERDNETTPIAV